MTLERNGPNRDNEILGLVLGRRRDMKRVDEASKETKKALFKDIEDEVRCHTLLRFKDVLEKAFATLHWEDDNGKKGNCHCIVEPSSNVYASWDGQVSLEIEFKVKIYGHGYVMSRGADDYNHDLDEEENNELCRPSEAWFKQLIRRCFADTNWVPVDYDCGREQSNAWFEDYHVEQPDMWDPPQWVSFQFELWIKQ